MKRAALLLLVCGCAPVGRYGAARTLPPEKIVVTAAAELPLGSEPPIDEWPFMGRLGVRGGLVEGVEFGGDVGTAAFDVGLDVKVELVRSEVFDLALDPSVRGGHYFAHADSDAVSFRLYRADLPVLIDINVTRHLSLVPHLTVGGAYRDDTLWGGLLRTELPALERFYPTLGSGLAIDIRLHRLIALQPMVAVQWHFDPSEHALRGFSPEAASPQRWVSLGLGIQLGEQPDFD